MTPAFDTPLPPLPAVAVCAEHAAPGCQRCATPGPPACSWCSADDHGVATCSGYALAITGLVDAAGCVP
jgi:hypothetical protein